MLSQHRFVYCAGRRFELEKHNRDRVSSSPIGSTERCWNQTEYISTRQGWEFMRQRNCFASGNNTSYTTRHWLLVSAALFVSLFPFHSVSAQYRFDSWTTDTGLPQNTVNRILQTRDGFIWLTTYGGLVRYDGLRFTVFNPGTTPELKSGRFRHLFEDRDGNLWINTEGQGVIRYHDGVFTTYKTTEGLPDNRIQHISGDLHGNVLIETIGGLVQWRDGSFIPYTPPAETVSGFLYRTAAGAIWYKDQSGLHQLENGQVTASLQIAENIKLMTEDRVGRLWMGTDKNTLLKFENGKFTRYSEKEGYPAFRLNMVFQDQQGNLWLASRGGGLLRYDEGKFTRYTTRDGLAGNDIASIYQDREGTLWAATTSGLSRFSNRIITTYSKADGLAANNVYPIYQDRQGVIWIGCWLGLTRYQNGVFTACDPSYGVSNALVSSLFEDRDGNFWIGILGDGVKRITKGQKGAFSPKELSGAVVRAITQDRDGNLWFGTEAGLLKHRDAAWTTFTTTDGLPGKTIFVIFEDRQGNLWVGTDAGLAKYRDGVFTTYTGRDELPAGYVRAIYEDSNGELWIGTYDSGLYRFKQGRFTRYTTNEGLFDNGVFQIIEDSRENFWISCNLGIYSVRKTELNDFAEGRIRKITTIPYGRHDGMLNSECNGGVQSAGIRASDGRIWFPTQEGVAVFAPDAISFNPQPPPVVIESIVSDNQKLPLHEAIEIRPGQNYFEINYAGLSFIAPEQVQFKYKLEGLDNDWTEAATRRTAYYTHLPPGSYRFVVIAANRDGVWNEEGATIQIIVIAPFWRTWWFISGVVLILAVASFLWYRQRILQLKRANEAQEEFSRRLIDSQESERKRIAAELHDSLGQGLLIIKNRAALSLKFWDDPVKALDQIKQLEGTATQSIKEVRQIAYALRPYQLDDIGLTQALKDLVKNVNGSSSMRFTAGIAYLDDLYSINQAINLYRMLQEAINNIIKHSEASQASVTITRDEREVEIVIKDNGRGFRVEAAETGGARKGFGLTGLSERARMLNGKLAVYSTPGQGTTVKLNLRIKEQDHEH
jgi:signal transduction histidine kinase/ligand-binding sensor domain-containing protein